MRRFGTVLSIIVCAASICRAEVSSVPDWLPEDQRFEVEGSSNEIAQVEQTLALMRDVLHTRLLAMMRAADKDEPTTNAYPTMMGPTLQWIAHVSLPTATNEAAYFDSYKTPLLASALDCVLLTNRAARLSYLPPTVKLSLVFDDGKRGSVSRAVPGVDYPGVSYEDEGSTSRALRLTLRAPGRHRTFKVRLQAWPRRYREVEFKWIKSPQGVSVGKWGPPDKNNLSEDVRVGALQNAFKKPAFVAFFVREKGTSLWGVPSFINLYPDDLGRHVYGKRGVTDYIDYGTFRDVYKLDEKDRIIGFTRFLPGMARGQEYSNMGELLIETHPDDKPKTTRKVRYAIKDGRLTYEVLEEDIHYKNGPMKFRKY